jgi:hypothetical protein
MEFHANNRLSLVNDLVTWYDRQAHLPARATDAQVPPANSKRGNNRLVLA